MATSVFDKQNSNPAPKFQAGIVSKVPCGVRTAELLYQQLLHFGCPTLAIAGHPSGIFRIDTIKNRALKM